MPPVTPLRRRDDWLLGQLPMGMLDDDFFVRFVSLFQEVATTLLHGADNVPNVVDVTVAPPELVRWLGTWIGVTSIDASLPEELQRRLVRESSQALAWRGTRRGLEGLLEALTGAPAVIEESGGVTSEQVDVAPAPWVRVTVASTGALSGPDLVALIADEVPANAALEVWVGHERIHAAHSRPPDDPTGAVPGAPEEVPPT
ncbi:MAG TPA: phage tail protein [Acidimicrobiales bacterium]|nr:phage tail protein [Acidimicrobiales bacterium]